jgi:K+/H+ antiporter YhaU regulatory subunit KhtT
LTNFSKFPAGAHGEKEDGDMLFNPSTNTTIGSGKKVITVGSIKSFRKLEEI